MPPIERLIEDIKIWCSEKRGRQMELAHVVGVHRSAITNWFAGRQRPTAEQAEKMRDLLTKQRREELSKSRSSQSRTTPITFQATEDVAENLRKFIELTHVSQGEIINEVLRATLSQDFREDRRSSDDVFISYVLQGFVFSTLEEAQAVAKNHRRHMGRYTLNPKAVPVSNPEGPGWIIKFVEPSEDVVQKRISQRKRGE
jgi:transcriptional regulator with XRE-family HTH domain